MVILGFETKSASTERYEEEILAGNKAIDEYLAKHKEREFAGATFFYGDLFR